MFGARISKMMIMMIAAAAVTAPPWVFNADHYVELGVGRQAGRLINLVVDAIDLFGLLLLFIALLFLSTLHCAAAAIIIAITIALWLLLRERMMLLTIMMMMKTLCCSIIDDDGIGRESRLSRGWNLLREKAAAWAAESRNKTKKQLRWRNSFPYFI